MGQTLSQFWPEPAPVRPYVHPSQYRCIPNVRIYSDGMSKGYTPNVCTLALAILSLAAYMSIPHLLLGLMGAAFFSRTALWTLAVLAATLLLPPKPLRVLPVLHSYLFLCWRRYFRFSYLFEESLDPHGDYIIAQFPHGAFPFGALLGGTFMAAEYPAYPCYALAANAAFWVPIWRHVHAWLGTEACTKTNFHRLLSKGVKGPLPHRHHHHSHSHSRQQQQQGGKSAGGSPFNSAEAAAAAAVEGVIAADTAAAAAPAATSPPPAAAAADSPLGPFASASLVHPPPSSLTPTEQLLRDAPAACQQAPLQRRTNSAPLGQRFSAAISLSSSLLGFKAHHTLSDSESSRSSSSSDSSSSVSESDGEDGLSDDSGPAAAAGEQQQAGEGGCCCACGSGLRCRDPQQCSSGAVAAAAAPDSSAVVSDGVVGGTLLVRAYCSDDDAGSSGSGRRSSSSSAASCCACCGACSVLAEVQSLPLDGLLRKQQSLMSIPSLTDAQQAALVEVQQGAGDSTALPLLGSHHQHHQQHHHHEQQQQQLSRQGSLQQQLLQHAGPQKQQQQQQQRAASVDPVTGCRRLGVSVGLMVGGIAEMFMIRRDHERIKLRERKGFVRIALEHGTDILPVYMFGVNQALDFGPPWLQRASRKMRASLGIIYGVWGLPIPRRVPIFMVTGRPLVVGPPMRKDAPGFAARVDELHAEFVREIERLYYAHRAKYGHGFENRPLVIC